MRGRWPCGIFRLLTFIVLIAHASAISYRCENNQALIVQSFGNDTIRMHCQRLHLCGYEKMECSYDYEQLSCGGKLNFVAHVNQATATGPVQHTCCELKLPNDKQNVPGHDGNDCFVYELPDGTHANDKARIRGSDDITVLKNANQIPEQFEGGYVGYRMRLFMLKNKSPPTLIVKAIERVSSGYRVTICRPRCGKFSKEGEVGHDIPNEQVVSVPVKGKSVEQWTTGKEGPEYQALQWGSWSSSTWETWKTTEVTEEDERASGTIGGTRSRASRIRTNEKDDSDESNPLATASASASAISGADTESGASGASGSQQKGANKNEADGKTKDNNGDDSSNTPHHLVNNNNINVKAHGGEGGSATINLVDPGKGRQGKNKHGRHGAGSSDEDSDLLNGDRRSGNGKSGSKKGGKLDGHDLGDNNLSNPIDEEDERNTVSTEKRNGRGKGQKIPNGRKNRLGKKNEKNRLPSGDSKENGNDASTENEPFVQVSRIRGNAEDKQNKPSNNRNGDNNGRSSGETDEDANRKGQNGKKHAGDEDNKIDGNTNKLPKTNDADNSQSSRGNSDGGNQKKPTQEVSNPDNEKLAGQGEEADNRSGNNPDLNNGKDGNAGSKSGKVDGQDETNGDAGSKSGNNPDLNNGQDAGSRSGKVDGQDGNKEANSGNNNQQQGGLDSSETGADNKNESDGNTTGDDLNKNSSENQGISQVGNDSAEANPDNSEEIKERTKLEEEDGSKSADSSTGVKLPDQNVGAGIETPDSSEENEELNSSGSGNGEEDCDKVDETSGEGSGEVNIRKKCLAGNFRSSQVGDNENEHGNGQPESQPQPAVQQQSSFVQETPSAQADPGTQASTPVQWGGATNRGPPPSCFSGDTLVETSNGPKFMRDLQVGDSVLVPSAGNALRYERIAMFYHREPETRVKFVRLETEYGKTLALTALHLLPFGDCSEMKQSDLNGDGVDEWMRKARFAHKAQTGDCLITLDDEQNVQIERIVKIGRQYSKGIYSPMTIEGSIITNNILASCFSQIESHATQKMAFDVLMMFYSSFGYLSNMAYDAVQDIPILLSYFHQFSWYILPFSKY